MVCDPLRGRVSFEVQHSADSAHFHRIYVFGKGKGLKPPRNPMF